MEKNPNKNLLLLGGGGHCRSVLDCALASGEYDRIGIIDTADRGMIGGIAVVGTDDDLPRLFEEGWNHAFIPLGSIGRTAVRRRLFDLSRESVTLQVLRGSAKGIRVRSVYDMAD